MSSGRESKTASEIIEVLSQEPLTPKELVRRVAADESVVRDLVWDLLDEGRLAVTQDRKLRPARKAAAG